MSYVFCSLVRIDELDAIKINHPLFTATLLIQGAQLIEFSPSDTSKNLLWLSKLSKFKKGKSIRGGIPICWPWFGDINKNPASIQSQYHDKDSLPAHGFARNQVWSVVSIIESCHSVDIELKLTSNPDTLKIWPYEFDLRAHFSFSTHLEMQLTTTNLSVNQMHFSQALHTYLPTTNINETYIHNTHSSHYIDALDNWKEKIQIGRIGFTEETDRLYYFKPDNREYDLRVETPSYQLIMNNINTQSAVIWNPWISKSLLLSQFSPDDYKTMFCIETANVLDDFKQLDCQDSDRIQLTLHRQ